MPEYEALRSLAKSAGQLPDWHPCQQGNAACCDERNVPTSHDDRKVITDAIASGAIPPQVVDRAKERAADPQIKQCPFLGDNRECTIREFYPIICAITGSAGLPVEDELPTYAENARRLLEDREDSSMPVAKTGSSMCGPCHQQLIDRRAEFPTSAMVVYELVKFHYDEPGVQPMATFVTNISREPRSRAPRPGQKPNRGGKRRK